MRFYQSLCYLFLMILCGCHEQIDQNALPDLTDAPKEIISINTPKAFKVLWKKTNDTKPKARIVKTQFNDYKEPFLNIKRFHPLLNTPDSLSFKLSELPSKSFSFPTATKVYPKIIQLGKPQKTKASAAVVDNLATCGLMQLSVDQGLSSSAVTGIVQDKDGRLWVSTDHGLTLYDGDYFYTWFKRDGLSRDELRFIYLDKRGHVWVGGIGVDEIIPEEGIIKHYGKQQGITGGIASISEDSHGRIIFGLQEGIDILDPVTNNLIHLGTKEGLTNALVNKLIEDDKGRLWLALNGGGVNVIDIPASKIYLMNDKNGLSNIDIRTIIQDKTGNIWMGGWYGGVDCYNPVTGKFIQYRMEQGFCSKYIRCLAEDSKGLIWISTLTAGLDVYDPVNKKIFHPFGKTGVVRSDCPNLFEDNYKRMWIGTSGGGLLLYDETTGSKDNFDTKWRYAKAPVNTTLEDAEGNYWIGTAGQGLDYYNVKDQTLKHLMNEDWTDGWLNKLYDDSLGMKLFAVFYRLKNDFFY